jgi:hypothetical protein
MTYSIYNNIFSREVNFMATKAKTIPVTAYRSSDTGKFVSADFAKKHPKSTYKQKINVKLPPKKK